MITRPLAQYILAAFALSAVAVGQPADGSFQVRYASNLTTQVSTVIYSTDGNPLAFDNTASYNLITDAACAHPGSFSTIGAKFTATASGNLQSITLPLVSTSTPTVTGAVFNLYLDNAGVPGTFLSTLFFSGISATPGLKTPAAIGSASLNAGLTYWLVADAPLCDNANTRSFGWGLTPAAPPVPGTMIFGTGTATVTRLPAFTVTATNTGESEITFSNTGANNAGDLCVNAYVFAPDEQLVSCCSCKVTRNALGKAFVSRDLTANTLTPAKENSVVIKLLSTAATAATCDPANPGVAAPGLAAWATTFHQQNATTGQLFASETPFTNASLSIAERNVMTGLCGFIKSNGSGYGICNICRSLTLTTF